MSLFSAIICGCEWFGSSCEWLRGSEIKWHRPQSKPEHRSFNQTRLFLFSSIAVRGANVPGRGVDPRHQLHGPSAQQNSDQQEQPSAAGRHLHVPGFKAPRALHARTPARSADLLHRQQHHQERFDGESQSFIIQIANKKETKGGENWERRNGEVMMRLFSQKFKFLRLISPQTRSTVFTWKALSSR